MPTPTEILKSLDRLIAQRDHLVMATTATINMADKSIRRAKDKQVDVRLYIKKLQSFIAQREAKELIELYKETGSLIYSK